MAKYDQFGRPIYETAEEYRKAHEKERNSRTYDSPEGSAYKHNPTKNTYSTQSSTGRSTVRTGVNKSNSVAVKLLIVMVCFTVGVIVAFSTVRSSYDDIYEHIEEDWIDIEQEVDDEEMQYIGDDSTPLPDGFETFYYDGQPYTLPNTMDIIYEMGLVLDEEYPDDYMLPTDYEESIFLNDETGAMAAIVRVSNYSGVDMRLDECPLTYFYIVNPVAMDGAATLPDFEFADGLTFESSYEDFESYFGEPYYHHENSPDESYSYDGYEWMYYGEDEVHSVNVTFYNGVISDISIEKRVGNEY